jgi:hypothetical protein
MPAYSTVAKRASANGAEGVATVAWLTGCPGPQPERSERPEPNGCGCGIWVSCGHRVAGRGPGSGRTQLNGHPVDHQRDARHPSKPVTVSRGPAFYPSAGACVPGAPPPPCPEEELTAPPRSRIPQRRLPRRDAGRCLRPRSAVVSGTLDMGGRPYDRPHAHAVRAAEDREARSHPVDRGVGARQLESAGMTPTPRPYQPPAIVQRTPIGPALVGAPLNSGGIVKAES